MLATHQLRHIQKHILIRLTPLQVIRREEMINPLLDDLDLRHEMVLHGFNRCRLQLLVRHLLPRLHHPNDSGVQEPLAV